MPNTQGNPHFLAIGGLVYTIVSALWVLIAYFFGELQFLILAISVVLLLVLVIISVTTLQQALKVSPITAGSSELGKWFGIIFAAEGLLIGIGSGILAGLNQTEWIAPWVAVVVALHFFPLGYLLMLPSDYLVGGAILGLTLVTVFTISSRNWARVLGLGTALLLWLAGWTRVNFSRKSLQILNEVQY